VEVQRVIALLSAMFPEAGTTALDLNTAAGLLLNMFDILAAVAYNRCAQVETGDRLQTNGYPLFGPLAL